MNDKVLLIGGYANMDITTKWIRDAILADKQVFINKFLYEKICDNACLELEAWHNANQLITVGLMNEKSDVVIDQVFYRSYYNACSQMIDRKVFGECLSYKMDGIKIRSLAGMSVNSYRNMYELFDIVIAHELNINSIVYYDMRHLCTVFSTKWENGAINKGFLKPIDKKINVYSTVNGKKCVVTDRTFKIGSLDGIYRDLLKKYINIDKFNITITDVNIE